jgi:hypothetical protein
MGYPTERVYEGTHLVVVGAQDELTTRPASKLELGRMARQYRYWLTLCKLQKKRYGYPGLRRPCDINWYHYTADQDGGNVRLEAINSRTQDTDNDTVLDIPINAADNEILLKESISASEHPYVRSREKIPQTNNKRWNIRGHPGEADSTPIAVLPHLMHKQTMPPLSHVLRFYTSVAAVTIDPNVHMQYMNLHSVLISGTTEYHASISLDPDWSGYGKEHTLIYISRWCPNFRLTYRDDHEVNSPEMLNLLLVENVVGWEEVKRRVQMLDDKVSVENWRKYGPRWECVSLA